MTTSMRTGSKLRSFALVTGAAYAVHQLRYLLAHEGGSEEPGGAQAHGYFELVVPLVAVVVLVALAVFAASLLETRRRAPKPCSAPGGGASWVSFSGILFGLYCMQEWLEGQIGQGHETGLGAIFGHGGWWAIPLVLAFGALVAWLLKGAATTLELVRGTQTVPRSVGAAPARTRRARDAQRPPVDVVASFLAAEGRRPFPARSCPCRSPIG